MFYFPFKHGPATVPAHKAVRNYYRCTSQVQGPTLNTEIWGVVAVSRETRDQHSPTYQSLPVKTQGTPSSPARPAHAQTRERAHAGRHAHAVGRGTEDAGVGRGRAQFPRRPRRPEVLCPGTPRGGSRAWVEAVAPPGQGTLLLLLLDDAN